MKIHSLLSLIASLTLSTQVLATQVNVNHLAPFAGTIEETEVAINVNGTEALTNFVYKQSTGYIELAEPGVAPGETMLEVFAPPGTDTPAISATLDLAADTFYSVTAIGDGVNQPLSLLALEDTQMTPSEGNLMIRVIHAAPFASDINETAASIRLDDGTVINGLDNVLFGQNSDYFEIPAGNYDLNVSSADGSTRLIDIAPIDLPAGVIVSLFAIGDGVNQPVGAYAVLGDGSVTELELETTRANLVHLAPFAANDADTAVSINANNGEILSGIIYQQSSGYENITEDGSDPGPIQLDVFAPPGAAKPTIMDIVDLAAQTDYTVAVIGDGTNQPLAILPLVDDNSAPAEGFAKVRIIHTAPFAAALEDTAVSIRTDSGDIVSGLSNVQFGQSSGYLELPEGLIDLNIATPDGSTVLIDLAPAYLTSGDIINVFATGDGSNQDLGFFVTFGNGTGAVLPLDKELTTLNEGLNGSWSDPENPGQGFLVEVLPAINTLFVAWFTYDTTAAEAGETAVVGEPNHRWLTAQGQYEGTSANLTLYLTQGGIFNQNAMTQTNEVGSLIINFSDCDKATVQYNITDSELSGMIPLKRISGSAVPFCQSLIVQ